MTTQLAEVRPISRPLRLGLAAASTLLLGLFATAALALTALCALPVIVVFTPWVAIAMWKQTRSHGHHHDYPDAQALAHAHVVRSGPIDRLPAHAAG